MAEPDEMLRMYLGEVIPDGGSDEDTMFTDGEITSFLTSADEDINVAAASGWTVKAGNLAHLVDMSEGSSRRSLRQRWENAKAMAEHFANLAASSGVGSTGRATRIRQIERS